MKISRWAATCLVLLLGSLSAQAQEEKALKADPKGIFITTVGIHRLHDGRVTVKIEEEDGWLSSYVTRTPIAGEKEQRKETRGPVFPPIPNDANWFIYSESPDEIWWYNGDRRLYVFPHNNRRSKFGGLAVRQIMGKNLDLAPNEVLGRLPKEFKEKEDAKAKADARAKAVFITTVGTYTLHDGKITLKIEEKNGKLDSYVTRNTLKGESSQPGTWGPLNPRIKKNSDWFMFTNSPDEVWWFDGDQHLYLFPYNNHQPGYQDGGIYQIGGDFLKIAPQEVLDRLPETFKAEDTEEKEDADTKK